MMGAKEGKEEVSRSLSRQVQCKHLTKVVRLADPDAISDLASKQIYFFQIPIIVNQALFFEEGNENLIEVDKTYLWGKEFLVSPVVSAEIKEQEVVFPKGSNWFNFYTNEMVKGNQTKMVQLSAESIPTYVRGGAFIPMVHSIQNTELYNLKSFDLHYYFDETVTESKGKLYNDDGETTNAFEKEQYEILYFKSEFKKDCLTISIAQEIGKNYTFSSKEISLILHNISKKPKKIKGHKFIFNEKDNTVVIPILLNNLTEKLIKIKF